jgi:hypothetical protein
MIWLAVNDLRREDPTAGISDACKRLAQAAARDPFTNQIIYRDHGGIQFGIRLATYYDNRLENEGAEDFAAKQDAAREAQGKDRYSAYTFRLGDEVDPRRRREPDVTYLRDWKTIRRYFHRAQKMVEDNPDLHREWMDWGRSKPKI